MFWNKSKLGLVVRDKNVMFESKAHEYHLRLNELENEGKFEERNALMHLYLDAFWSAYPVIIDAITKPTPDVLYEVLCAIGVHPNSDNKDIQRQNDNFLSLFKKEALKGRNRHPHLLGALSERLADRGIEDDLEAAQILSAQYEKVSAQAKQQREAEEQAATQKLEKEQAAALKREEIKNQQAAQKLIKEQAAALKREEAEIKTAEKQTAVVQKNEQNNLIPVKVATPLEPESIEDILKKANRAYEQKDYQLAFNLFTQTAGIGNPEACYQLAQCFEQGHGTKINMPCALYFFARAVGLKHALAAQPFDGHLALAAAKLIMALNLAKPEDLETTLRSKLIDVLIPEPTFMHDQILKHPVNRTIVIGILRKAQETSAQYLPNEKALSNLIALLHLEFKILDLEVDFEIQKTDLKNKDEHDPHEQLRHELLQLLNKPNISDEQIISLLPKNAESLNYIEAKNIIEKTCILLMRTIHLFKKVPQKAAPKALNLIKLLDFNKRILNFRVHNSFFIDLKAHMDLKFSPDTERLLSAMEVAYDKSIYNFYSLINIILQKEEPGKIKELYSALATIVSLELNFHITLAPFLYAVVLFESQFAENKHPLISALLALSSDELTDKTQWEHIFKRLCKKPQFKDVIHFSQQDLNKFISYAIWVITACRLGKSLGNLTDAEIILIQTHSTFFMEIIDYFDIQFKCVNSTVTHSTKEENQKDELNLKLDKWEDSFIAAFKNNELTSDQILVEDKVMTAKLYLKRIVNEKAEQWNKMSQVSSRQKLMQIHIDKCVPKDWSKDDKTLFSTIFLGEFPLGSNGSSLARELVHLISSESNQSVPNPIVHSQSNANGKSNGSSSSTTRPSKNHHNLKN